MKVHLTRSALNEVRSFGAYMARSERDKQTIPTVSWVFSSESHNEITGEVTRRGPHFILGAQLTDRLWGLMIFTQDGVTFGIALPKEAEGLDWVEIDYKDRDFFISN